MKLNQKKFQLGLKILSSKIEELTASVKSLTEKEEILEKHKDDLDGLDPTLTQAQKIDTIKALSILDEETRKTVLDSMKSKKVLSKAFAGRKTHVGDETKEETKEYDPSDRKSADQAMQARKRELIAEAKKNGKKMLPGHAVQIIKAEDPVLYHAANGRVLEGEI